MPLTKGKWDPWKMAQLATLWLVNGVEKVIIEECQAFPGISAAANASVMEAFGMWRGVLGSKFDPAEVVIVSSKVWKPAMDLSVKLVKAGKKATPAEKLAAYMARKAKAMARARAEFGLTFVTPKGREMDGEAEAALLALYGSKLP